MEEKVSTWVTEVEQLSSFAKSQPHAAFAACTHGLCHRWTYLTRVLPVTGSLLQPLEDAIRQKFIPSLTGQPPCNDQMQKLLALPPRQGGLGIINPLMLESYSTSAIICQPLVEAILGQGGRPLKIRFEQHRLKHEQRVRQRKEQADAAKSLTHELPEDLQRTVQAASEQGASAWLTALPVEQHGFALHKGAFLDAIAFRYG